MSDEDSTNLGRSAFTVALPFTVASIWSLLNWSRLLDWTATLGEPIGGLAWWVSVAFIVNGVVIVLSLVLLVLIVVFGGLWLLAGKTTDGWSNNL